jgi:hypothetical protein
MSAVCGDPPCSTPRKESDKKKKKKVSEGKEGEEFGRFAHIRHHSFKGMSFETFWTFFTCMEKLRPEQEQMLITNDLRGSLDFI